MSRSAFFRFALLAPLAKLIRPEPEIPPEKLAQPSPTEVWSQWSDNLSRGWSQSARIETTGSSGATIVLRVVQ